MKMTVIETGSRSSREALVRHRMHTKSHCECCLYRGQQANARTSP